jgi:hypothetical protein
MYYDPQAIPSEHLHAYSFDGVVPWSNGTVSTGGFRGMGFFAVACREGGPRNGVWTAVEDFLTSRPDYRAVTVPCIFGLALLFPSDAPWANDVASTAGRYDGDPFLARMEANRVRLYLQVIDLDDRFAAERRRFATVETDLGQKLDEIRLKASVAEQLVRRHDIEKAELQEEVRILKTRISDLPALPPRRSLLDRVLPWIGA